MPLTKRELTTVELALYGYTEKVSHPSSPVNVVATGLVMFLGMLSGGGFLVASVPTPGGWSSGVWGVGNVNLGGPGLVSLR